MSVLYIVAVENLWHVGQNVSHSYETREFRNVMIVLFLHMVYIKCPLPTTVALWVIGS